MMSQAPQGNAGSGFNPMDLMSKMGWGQMFGGLGQLGSLLFGGHNFPKIQDPSKSAMPFLNQIPETLRKAFEPYIQGGMNAQNQLQSQYNQLTGGLPGIQNQLGQMMNDPAGMMKKLGEGYQQSPGLQFQLGQGTQAALNAAAAGGMAGSPQHQQQASEIAQNIANKDFQQYLQNAMGMQGQGLMGQMGLFGQGMQGLQDLQKQGFQAGTGLGENLANALMGQGNMAYGGALNQQQMELMKHMMQQQQQGGIGSLIGNMAGLIPFLL